MRANSPKSVIKTVVLTARSRPEPAASSTPARLASTCRVWASIPPSTRFPVAGFSPAWPEANTNGPALMACEYGPIGLGALGSTTTSLICLGMRHLLIRIFGGVLPRTCGTKYPLSTNDSRFDYYTILCQGPVTESIIYFNYKVQPFRLHFVML